ncbi:MAG: preprotein translocase subunit SecG [Anaerolineaceae bacterium]|nr:preprotein translocase subunit SecG [Anaerolineaceae bacterium]
MDIQAALQIAAVIISILLIVLILLQVKGGGLGSLRGGDAGGGIARARGGLATRLFQITIIIAVLFLAISIVAVLVFQ